MTVRSLLSKIITVTKRNRRMKESKAYEIVGYSAWIVAGILTALPVASYWVLWTCLAGIILLQESDLVELRLRKKASLERLQKNSSIPLIP